MKSFFLLAIMSFTNSILFAQPNEKDEQLWLGYVNSIKFHKNWSVNSDLNYRTGDQFTSEFRQTVLRTSLTFTKSEKIHLSVGFAYSYQKQNGNLSYIHENRAWQQIHHFITVNGIKFHHRFRLEERLRNHYANEEFTKQQFQIRFRYFTCLQMPIFKIKSRQISLVIQDEIMAQSNPRISGVTFDQNRFFSGFNLQITPTTSIQPGYLIILQKRDNSIHFSQNHCIRINLIQNIDLSN